MLHTSDTHLRFRPGELCVVILAPSVLQMPASLNQLMKLINIGRRPYSKGQQRFHSELNMVRNMEVRLAQSKYVCLFQIVSDSSLRSGSVVANHLLRFYLRVKGLLGQEKSRLRIAQDK